MGVARLNSLAGLKCVPAPVGARVHVHALVAVPALAVRRNPAPPPTACLVPPPTACVACADQGAQSG